jgi:hypothetical protein
MSWNLSPLDYVEDPDDDDFTVTADLGLAAILFDYEDDKLYFKQTDIEEFYRRVSSLQGTSTEAPIQVKLIAQDLLEAETTLDLNFYFSMAN